MMVASVSCSYMQVSARKAGDPICKCNLQYHTNVSADQQKKLLDWFWKTSNFNVQNTYLCGCVQVSEVKWRYARSGSASRQKYTWQFYVKAGSISVRVCKVAFLNIFGISNGRLDRALKAEVAAGGSPHSDQRGKHSPANKTSEEATSKVKAHIESFPWYKSHYSRKDNPNRCFLSPDLRIQIMHCLFSEKCTKNNEEAVSLWVYRQIFNECYNLSFGK